MLQRSLNLGILAHVDAGKTTLTERLLHVAGVIAEVGSVDAGTTQTDTLALERQRGITIKSAVVSFTVDGTVVNLIDTPGHPDFIAEVERVLNVLDGAVLVVSAVEGVQPQTRILMRALQRLAVPTVLFVNKIDRSGADIDRVLAQVSSRLSPAAVPMATAAGVGGPAASVRMLDGGDAGYRDRLVDVLAGHDDSLLAAYVDGDGALTQRRLVKALRAQTRRCLAHPVYVGSALTGVGVEQLVQGTVGLLGRAQPRSASDDGISGLVFKIGREPSGERVAYVRMFGGELGVRQRVPVGSGHTGHDGRATAIAVFEDGRTVRRSSVAAGRIAKVWGLDRATVGDRIGTVAGSSAGREFAPPTLESVVVPADPADGHRLRLALGQLADQDPLIGVRTDPSGREVAVSLYGEVQKEVIAATLATEYGLAVTFHPATPLYVERPTRVGEAVEELHADSNPYNATVGLQVEPAAVGSGIAFRLEVPWSAVPLYVYKRAENFAVHMEEYVREALAVGPHGWQVTDCVVTLNRCMYSVPDGPPSRSGPLSTAADFRKLTPLVLAQALERAATVVCEPTERLQLEVPANAVGGILAALARLGATVEVPLLTAELGTVEAIMAAVRVPELRHQLAGLTGGEGLVESSFAGYRPLVEKVPTATT